MNLTDYRSYKLTAYEYLLYGVAGTAFALIISYLFYHSLIPAVFFLPFSAIYFKQLSAVLCRKRKETLCRQFKDTLAALSAALEAGFSVENAIWEAYLQISVIYSRNSYMAAELIAIYNQIKVSVPVEEAFSRLSSRTDAADILTFCEILKIAKRTDGNIVSIIKTTAGTLNEKFEIDREIRMNINGKKFEQLIMTAMPMLIIIYIKLSTPDFFNPLYHNTAGIIFVTICLLLYGLSVLLSIKITRIEA